MTVENPDYDASLYKRLVGEKEAEWRHLAELRAEKAELALERVKSESKNDKEKLNKLKADFSFNLDLLSSRDKELDEAEKTIIRLKENIVVKERECSELSATLDALKAESEKYRKEYTSKIDSLRQESEKRVQKYHNEIAAQLVSLKIEKEQLEQKISDIEANYSISKRQLEKDFEEQLNNSKKLQDSQLDQLRALVTSAETEARILAKELDSVRDSERSRRKELSNLQDSYALAQQNIRDLNWELSNQSSTAQSDLKELKKQLDSCRAENNDFKSEYEQRLSYIGKDLADKIVLLDRLQQTRFEDAGEAGRKIGEMQGEISKLRASTERVVKLEEELRLEKNISENCRLQLHQYEAQLLSLNDANLKLQDEIAKVRKNGTLNIELHSLKQKYAESESHNKRITEQNELLKNAVHQMKQEVEALISKPERVVDKPQVSNSETQTDAFSSIFYDGSNFEEDKQSEMPSLPHDPRLKKYVDNLLQRTTGLQHRCSELIAEGRRQQIKAESAISQLESLESDSQKFRSALEHSRYELSAERSRFEADRIASKKQVADLEERLAEARVIADEFHAEANNATVELSELRRRLASHELTQKSASTGVGFGGQELYIQQLEDQIKDFATRAKPLDEGEATSRLKRAISIIVQLQKDRNRLLDLAARLRATVEEYRQQLENGNANLTESNLNKGGPPLSTRSNLRPQSQLEKLEILAYEKMREKLAKQMSARSQEREASFQDGDLMNVDEDLAELSTSFPNSDAIYSLLNQIDDATAIPQSELSFSARQQEQPSSPKKRVSRISSLRSPAPPSKGRGQAMSRVWKSERSPPPLKSTGLRGGRGISFRK